ncbi:MAG TPA: VWA domain-containing protein [Thermoanaerobaculia bacterium]|jgi:VWFA-related protein|nr:VWA domain-containing protein [Thermoanaerobaculia bacterium]
MWSAGFLVLSLLFAAPVFAQLPAAEPPSARFAVPIDIVDAKGRPVEDLTLADLELLVDGAPRPPAELSSPQTAGPWRIVLYFDRVTTGTQSLRAAADALIEQLPALAALGEVEVMVAEPEPRELVPPTRAIAPLEEALAQLFVTAEGRDDLRQARARFAAREPGAGADRSASDAADALAAEERIALRQQDRWLELLARPSGSSGSGPERTEPRVILLVSDGYDLDPAPAYGVRRAGAPPLDRASRATAAAAAELGWTVFALRLGDEKLPDPRRWGLLAPAQGIVGGRVTLPVPIRPIEPAVPLPSLADPIAPLRRVAEQTGGAFAATRAEVEGLVASLGRRRWLSWDGPALAAGGSAAIEVRSKKATRSVRAPARIGAGVPAEVAAARGRALLAGEDLDIDFDLRAEEIPAGPSGASGATGAPEAAALPARIEARIEAIPAAPNLRFTRLTDLYAAPEALAPSADAPVAEAPESPSAVRIASWPLAPGDAGGGVLIADDPGTGLLGASLIERPEASAPEVAEVEAAPAGAASPAARRPKNGLAVRILRPTPGKAEGPVEVEAEVRMAPEARLDRVEFFWNDELAATAYKPPFKRAVPVPRGGPVGFLRVAARLADGTVVDDAVLMNAGAAGERVDVRLVEVPVVVTDRAGHPVRGLLREDFRLKRNGVPQEISGFGDTGDLPLTLALAVDSSASMFLKLPRVERAARTLLLGALAPRDRALLVDFDSTPRLLAHPTRDLRAVAEALSGLRADGGTALWSAVVYALRELGGVAGRKALVVYSDGVGEEDPTSYGECLRAARASRVPVYLILSSSVSARKAGSLLREPLGEKLERLARATGGDAIFLDASLGADPGATDDLSAVYRRILAELRSQYLLTFYPPEGSGDSWQNLAVEVKKPGLSARALEGYVPRRFAP